VCVQKGDQLRRVLIGQRKYAVSIARASLRYRYNLRHGDIETDSCLRLHRSCDYL